MGFTEAMSSSFVASIDCVTYLPTLLTIQTQETVLLETEVEFELRYCIGHHDSKLFMFKTGPILVVLRIHPLIRVSFSFRGIVSFPCIKSIDVLSLFD